MGNHFFMASHEKFHKEADKNYWKTISELIPNEVPTIEKKRGKKEQEKKPSIAVIQGPKRGKPTDLARMRQILVKLKHNTPIHLKLASPPADAKTDGTTPEASQTAAAAVTPEAVAVA
ncbi:clathrin light chain 2-like [Beta vulgaris subsp. vulgaris]|uniref:clathrin light chain 2-like n=1 Tax=Beta vulgaris subsp. vulgaris TaxID=3555 RepID=UPI0025477C81|nr:clathrin light chain 2-like [Beta vulgaris subsp. vulgaris]